MTSWQEIDRANRDGSLDHALLPDLMESRRTLAGHINVHDAQARVVIMLLTERVADLIKKREQEERDKTTAEFETKKHSEIVSIEQKKVDVSEKALRISLQANSISIKANNLSEESNKIAHGAHVWAIVAILFSMLALGVSSCQWYFDHKLSAKSHNESLGSSTQEIGQRTLSTNIAPLSIATNAMPMQQTPK